MKTHFEHLEYYVPGLAGRRILDLGSGSGRFLVEAAARGAAASGLEYNPANVAKTIERAKAAGVQVEVRQGAAERLPYADASFDFINICEVIEHVESPGAMLSEAARVLSPGGAAYLSVPNRFGLKDQHFGLYFVNWLPRRFAGAFISAFGKHKSYSGESGRQRLAEMHYYTYRSIKNLVRQKGFKAADARALKLRKKYPLLWPLLLPAYAVLRAAYFDAFHLLLTKPGYKKILVVQTGKLGDMVCTTPVFRAIKQSYPRAALWVAGSALNVDVLHGNPHVDHYVDYRTLDAAGLHKGAFDAAVLLNPNPGVLRTLQKSRIEQIIVPKVTDGYSPYMTKRYRFWSLFATRVPHRMGHYAPQEYLNALAPLGITAVDTRKELFVTGEAQAAADALLAPYSQKLKIAIAPGAGNKIKEWPPERFNEVAKELVKNKAALVVIIGGPADAGLAKIVAKDLPQGSVLDTAGKLSIEELKALIKRMSLFVSADTGPIYIAEAFDIPTVDIVGPVDERVQPPRGPNHLVVVPSRTKAQLYIMNARVYDEAEARRQVQAASVEQVLTALETLL